ncbi:MAG: hypothetical protein J5J00_04685 [Deltaproteobacteria bacterium]|nr:hypothetical protein [Deltaproteobacteria bacterium]
MSSNAQAVLDSDAYTSGSSAAAILTPDNHDQLDDLYDGTLSAQLAFYDPSEQGAREEYRNGPQRLSDLLDSTLEVHMKRAGDFIIVETSHAGFDNYSSCCVSVWAWDESTLALQRCFSQHYEFGVDSIALDSDNGTLAVATDGSVNIYTSSAKPAPSGFHPSGHFRLDSVGFSESEPALQFEGHGVLALHSKVSGAAPLKIAL